MRISTHKYGVILDAGSSGTRAYVYQWDDPLYARKSASPKQLQALPKLKTKKQWTRKSKPGISTYADRPASVGPEHLEELFAHAAKKIPKELHESTPLFLLATAGMRLVPERERKLLLDEVCDYARRNTNFLLPDCDQHVQVIPGETEGLYGWVAANYLVGGLDDPKAHDHGKNHHTYGFLDMGGASAQIAFAPNSTEAEKHANDLKLLRLRNLGGKEIEHRVFVTTWLGFGVNEARRRYVEHLIEASGIEGKEIPDPCLPKGLRETLDGDKISDMTTYAKKTHLVGTGKFEECERQLYPFLDKEKPCADAPCLLNGQHVPAIDFDVNHFLGVSEYWHTTTEIFEGAKGFKNYDFSKYQQQVAEYCSRDWSSIEADVGALKWGKKVDEKKAMHVCFKASWVINVLHDGIGVPRIGVDTNMKAALDGGAANVTTATSLIDAAKKTKATGFTLDPFLPVDTIDNVEVSWTLGRMVLYAASQIPSTSDHALPVGFGDNIPSPSSPPFQYGGTGAEPLYLSDGPSNGTLPVSSWPSQPPTTIPTSSHRFPALILIFVVISAVILCLIGRDRRSHLFRKVWPLSRHHSRRRKIHDSTGTVTYERVLEEGTDSRRNSFSPIRFELGPYSSNSSSDDEDNYPSTPRSAQWGVKRSSTWDGPGSGSGNLTPGGSWTPGSMRGLGELGSAASSSTRLGAGLGSRTQSRERLTAGWASRDASPGPRARSPMPRR
ncbi:hypothetical protein EX30DRAFT_144278 [Ascodesmis nigricans]|uniref:Nucleoside diphosphatase n=1 Tax=Ascodesmis nigricans TaxID=341454 RepID=A0A4S2N1H8_9PEZI|nr:hypothetical protein EX30DRAFT_144278 [Ascodesmis nigricans]